MTATVSASPIALLTTVVDPAAASSGTAASTAGSAVSAESGSDNSLLPGLEGGFQLLIDAAAQQQTAMPVPLKNSTKTATAGKSGGEESGNVLPLLAALLPSDTQGATEPGMIGQGSDGQGSDKDSEDKSADQAAAAAAAVQLLWTPVNVQAPATAPNTAATAAGNANADADTAVGTVATATAPSANPIGAAMADANAGEQTVAAQGDSLLPNDSASNKAATSDRHNNNRADVLTAANSSNNATKFDVSPQDLIGATQKPADTSASFADLLKPTNPAAAVNPLTAPIETNRTQQAARPYVEMNSTGATVSVPVGSSGWSDAVVDKVMWFSANKFSSAEIQLNPPDLGPLQVRISTQHDQASVVFSSPHAAVRDALDQALPRLRDMLGGQGIQLSDASVGGQGAQAQQQQAQQQNGERRASAANFFQGDDSSMTPTAVTRVQVPRLSTSAVDAYA